MVGALHQPHKLKAYASVVGHLSRFIGDTNKEEKIYIYPVMHKPFFEENEKNRLETFIDAILAIVMTILVLEFKVPEQSYSISQQRLPQETLRKQAYNVLLRRDVVRKQ